MYGSFIAQSQCYRNRNKHKSYSSSNCLLKVQDLTEHAQDPQHLNPVGLEKCYYVSENVNPVKISSL